MDAQTREQVLALETMGVARLRLRYAEVFGERTQAGNKAWLVKRIAWRLQALAEGGLSQRARQRAAELAADADLRLNPPRPRKADPAPEPQAQAQPQQQQAPAAPRDPRLPPAGSVITRRYKGEDVQVLVLPAGFRYGGEDYDSLSAVAKAVTGSHQNGFLFFKLTKGGEA